MRTRLTPAKARRPAAISARRRRFPFEQSTSRDTETNQRHGNRVDHLVRVIGQEGQVQDDADDVGVEIVARGSQECRSGFQAGWSAEKLKQPQAHRQHDRGEADRRPHHRRAGENGPAEQQHGDRCRRHQAAPQIVEDLPAGHDRQPIALQAGS